MFSTARVGAIVRGGQVWKRGQWGSTSLHVEHGISAIIRRAHSGLPVRLTSRALLVYILRVPGWERVKNPGKRFWLWWSPDGGRFGEAVSSPSLRCCTEQY